MKKAIAGIVAIAGIASVAAAATTVTYQVRTVGGVWGSSVDVLPGTQVEFRTLVSTNGNFLGLAGFNQQPMVSNTVATDAFAPFITTYAAGANNGISDLDSGSYGRRFFAGQAGVPATSALRGHTNLVSGVRYMRIAQNNTTNFPGVGSGANNSSGAGGVPSVQNAPGLAGAAFVSILTNLEVTRFAFIVSASGGDGRVLTINSANQAMIVGTATPLIARATWYDGATAFSSTADPITAVNAATINVVPTPGALALLGMGGLIAGRRRRA